MKLGWKQKLAEGESECGIVRKGFVATVKAADDDSRVLSFVISTDAVDRHGDTIDPSGWDLSLFRKNPVVLWQHNSYEGPIAKASNVRVEDGVLKADATFATVEEHPLAERAYRLFKGGFMHAVSVGFKIKEWTVNEDRAGWMPMDILQAELWEFSAVSIPANPEALIEGREVGVPEEREVEEVAVYLDGAAYVVTAEQKAGRVLSQKNYDRLTEARDALTEVLASAEPKEDDEDEEKGTAAAVLEIITA